MITARNIVQWLWGSLMMGSLLLPMACAEDNDNVHVSGSDEPQSNQLRLSSATREGEATTPAYLTEGNIKVFVTNKDDVVLEGSFSKNSTDAIWNSSNLAIKENTQYYLYGYMPSMLPSTFGKPDGGGDFSGGAKLTLSDLPVFTDEDFRVIVSVQRVTDDATFTTATEGRFSYLSGASSQNYVNFLMGHLYSQLQLQFCVGKTYYDLRRIHLKSVKLKSTYVARGTKVTATVNLKDGKGLTGQVEYTEAAASTPDTPEEWSLLTDGDLPLVVEPETNAESPEYTVLSNTVNCPHCIFDTNGTYLTIECSYDVYDTNVTTEHPDGNLIREGCTATNKVKVTGMAPGVKKILTLTVAPTYLYVLSDDDLNNPTIHIN